MVCVASGLPVNQMKQVCFLLHVMSKTHTQTHKQAWLLITYQRNWEQPSWIITLIKIHTHTYYCVNIKAIAQSPNQIICFLSRKPIQDRNKAQHRAPICTLIFRKRRNYQYQRVQEVLSSNLRSLEPEADVGGCSMQQEDRTARALHCMCIHARFSHVCTRFNMRMQKKWAD